MLELGYPQEEIATKLKISRPSIGAARTRLEPILEALKTIAGEEPKDLRNKDVQAIVEAFSETFGTTAASKYDRFAASRLAKKHGADGIVKVIKLLGQNSGDKYTPVVNNVRQIEEKWPAIGAFFTRMKKQQRVDL